MKDKMLLHSLIACCFMMEITKAQTTMAPNDHETVWLEYNTPTADDITTLHPTQTTSGSFTDTMVTDIPTVKAQTDETASYSTDTTFAVLNMIGSTTQSLSSNTFIASSEIPTVAAPNADTVSPTVDATQSAPFLSTMSATSLFESTVQTSSSTQLAPTAKSSATTEIVSDLVTTKSHKMTDYETQTSTLQTTEVQKTSSESRKTSIAMEANTETEPIYIETLNHGVNHGRIIAWIIGGALIVMLIGFLVIWYKRQKLKSHQIATTEWAGPTPFLESGEVNNGSLRGASMISLTSFLPQRLSKRLSLLAEEMPDMYELTTSSTFAGKEEKKVEKNGVQVGKVDENLNKSNEAVEKKPELSNKTEDVVLVDELTPNGDVKSKDDHIGPEKTTDGMKESEKVQPTSAEDSPKEVEVN